MLNSGGQAVLVGEKSRGKVHSKEGNVLEEELLKKFKHSITVFQIP